MKIGKIVLLGLVLSIGACSEDDKEEPEVIDTNNALKVAVVENYAEIVYANYLDAYNEAVNLQSDIASYLEDPSSEILFEAAKIGWKDAREPYGQTEAFRFANGPIDDSNGPEGLLNAWPLDEAYIDYVTGSNDSGIINDTANYPEISKEVLESLNEQGKDDNISIGYHAIEFLLWGQDEIIPTQIANKGARPVSDYVTDGTKNTIIAKRRGEYLQVCADLIVDHLQLMLDEWKVGGAYRTVLTSQEVDVTLANIFNSIGILSKAELAGERIFVAYNNESQEDEHSCFSDNTHRDIILNAQGISNVYNGEYMKLDGTKVSGTSLSDLMADQNESTESAVQSLLSDALLKCNNIGAPFDYAVTSASGNRTKVFDAAVSLQTLGSKFSEAGTELGLTVTADFQD